MSHVVVLDADAARAPSLVECVREDLDCVCGVHGYALYAEFDYFCDACGHSENAEFHENPRRIGSSCFKARRIKPEKVKKDRGPRSSFMNDFFKRSHRPKSA